LDTNLEGNGIGINIRGDTHTYNSIDIIRTYIETLGNKPSYGIRLDPILIPNAVRIEGGRVDDPKVDDPKNDQLTREIEVHGYYNIIDVPVSGNVYGTLDTGTQLRSGHLCIKGPPCVEAKK
jgi:hypothetical protein